MKRWERSGTDEVDPVIPMSLKEYLSSRFRPDMDYYQGAARERNRGLRPHAETIVHVAALLEEQAEHYGLHGLISCRTRVGSEAVLVPDICLIRNTTPYEGVLVTPPVLCVEILDEADTFHTMLLRVDMFRSMGVEHIWLVDECVRFGFHATAQGLERPVDGVLRVPETSIEFALTHISDKKEDRLKRRGFDPLGIPSAAKAYLHSLHLRHG